MLTTHAGASRTRVAATGRQGTAVRALTLRLDPESFRRLALLATAENRSPTNYVETLVLREIQARSESRRVLQMHAAPETVGRNPGPLLRGEGEPDQRYAERKALFEELLALPDAD